MSLTHVLPLELVPYEYVWVDGDGELRSKTKFVDPGTEPPEWTYDGSSTKQALGTKSDVLLKPVRSFTDPFNKGGRLVLCDTYEYDFDANKFIPHKTNTRVKCLETMDKVVDMHPWFGVEQEYILYDRNGNPHKWHDSMNPNVGLAERCPELKKQGPYYCSAGGDRAFGRELVTEHWKACLNAGVKLAGLNAEVMPSQWEFQVGICEGIELGDHLLMARYLLQRVTEKYGVRVEFHPKPKKGEWNGSGCHTNYSTKAMREDDGLKWIVAARDKLTKTHDEHIKNYGLYNNERMTGEYETSTYDEFHTGTVKKDGWTGVGDRGASIRIPLHVFHDGKGYLEDRRPASNMDPYVVSELLVRTTCLKV
jgi:glutamine synthetase